jgi:acetyl esterase
LEVVVRIATVRAKKQGSHGQGDKTNQGQMAPTHANVKYGKDERNVFDIWLAKSDKPTSLAIYIHGGGFRAGSKEKLSNDILSQLLKAGISVASINYRYLTIDTPLPTSHHDARRALQFMRSKAEEWNLDKSRVAAFGGSAGAQICMWLAYSDDMAKAKSKDPIERESTRLTCVATTGGQTTNQTEFWKEMITDIMGSKIEAEGFVRPLDGLVDPEKIRMATWGASTLAEMNQTLSRHSALSLISEDDPPIFMSYGMPPSAKPPTDRNRLRGWIIHHVNLGIALKEKTDALELEAHLKYPGAELKYPSQIEFLVDKLLN